MNPSILAIIPARKGSKRIPGKNTRSFGGKPLIQWSIDEALKCKRLSKVVVTTDDENILIMKNKYPDVEFIERPVHLAGDEVSGVDPVVHVMEMQKNTFDYILLLQCTSPLRKVEHIDAAIERAFSGNSDHLISVRRSQENLRHMLVYKPHAVQYLSKVIRPEDTWVINGAVYFSKWNIFLKEKSFMSDNTEIFEMDMCSSIDIDTQEDWDKALSYLD